MITYNYKYGEPLWLDVLLPLAGWWIEFPSEKKNSNWQQIRSTSTVDYTIYKR